MDALALQKIQILLAEHATLRAEIIARIGHMYQLIGIGVPLIGLLFIQIKPFSLNIRSQDPERRTNAWLFWSIVAGFAVIMTWAVGSYYRDLNRLAYRIAEIELDVNDRAKEDLMVWESLWGDVATGFWPWQWSPPFDRTSLQGKKPPPRTYQGQPKD